MREAILKTDGGSRGNPGLSGLGYSLTDLQGTVVNDGGWVLLHATNNVAEYSALIWGLQNALAAGVNQISVFADSELMVKQLNGSYQVKSEDLKPLFMQAKALSSHFDSITIEHIYRDGNKEADRLANEAMDARMPVGTFAVPWDGGPRGLFDDSALPGNGPMHAAGVPAGRRGHEAAAGLEPDSRAEDADAGEDAYQVSGNMDNRTRGDELEDRRPMEKNERYTGPHQLSGESYEQAGGHYEMTLKDHFDAAHTLPGYAGPCRFLHGHTWDVEVTVAGEHLDEVGILYDFKDLKRDLHALLENFDHRYINDTPPFDVINPTAENLARVIFFELEKSFPAGIYLQEVAVWESPVAKITFRP